MRRLIKSNSETMPRSARSSRHPCHAFTKEQHRCGRHGPVGVEWRGESLHFPLTPTEGILDTFDQGLTVEGFMQETNGASVHGPPPN